MSEVKHTPGPWVAKKSPFEVINRDHGRLDSEIVAGNVMIAALYESSDSPDANLIAAAPELLEALKEARHALNSANVTIARELGSTNKHRAYTIHLVSDAIAKAEGRSE